MSSSVCFMLMDAIEVLHCQSGLVTGLHTEPINFRKQLPDLLKAIFLPERKCKRGKFKNQMLMMHDCSVSCSELGFKQS